MSGEPEAEHCSAAFRVLGREVSTLSAGKVAGDGEPEARPPAVAAPGAVRPVEAVEDAGEVLGRYPGPGVRDAHLDPAVERARRYVDPTSRGVCRGLTT